MKLTTFTSLLALLLLAAGVRCQNEPDQDLEKEVDEKVETAVDNAAKTVCQAFSPDDEDQSNPQRTKRGFFKKVWKGVKKAAFNYAVGKVVKGIIGKRDHTQWEKENVSVQERRRISSNRWWKDGMGLYRAAEELQGDASQTDICDPDTQKKIQELEQAIEVLGRTTHLLQQLKTCNDPRKSP